MYTIYRATYYFQGGAAGSCGNVNPDSALIVAVRASLSQPYIHLALSTHTLSIQRRKATTLPTADVKYA